MHYVCVSVCHIHVYYTSLSCISATVCQSTCLCVCLFSCKYITCTVVCYIRAPSDTAPTIFTDIDLKHAYFQVKLTDKSKPKTAFTVVGKNYEYCRMVMGLNNSAQCWQRLLTKVLSDMLFTSAIVYLDDVLLLSKKL